jgi:hypothetical protein
MEVMIERDIMRNGLGQVVDVEEQYVYPLIKSSDFAQPGRLRPRKSVLIPQRSVNDDTRVLESDAPKLWRYLTQHADFLDNRRSSIYKSRFRFAIFGIGEYSFSRWKVGISGFYKNLNFRVIEPHENQPVMLDDTCYFVPAKDRDAAEAILSYLTRSHVQDFLSAFIFWDDKRPVKAELLEQLDMSGLAHLIGMSNSESTQLALV